MRDVGGSSKLTKEQYKALLGRMMEDNPKAAGQTLQDIQIPAMQPMGPRQMGTDTFLPPTGIPEVPAMQEAAGRYGWMDPVGQRLYERLYAQSPNAAHYESPEAMFTQNMARVMQGEQLEDQDEMEFFQHLMAMEGKQFQPGWGEADEMDMQVIQAMKGGMPNGGY
jgi:hypothetical protein